MLDPAVWPGAVYACWQVEIAPTTGQHHIQGYVAFDRKRTLVWVKDECDGLGSAHLESTRGTAADNKIYCSKEEGRLEGPFEWGDIQLAPSPGSRSDLAAVASLAKTGVTLKRIAEEHTVEFIKYPNGISKVVTMFERKRSTLTICFVLYGSGGSGKSTMAALLADYLIGDAKGAAVDHTWSLPEVKGSGIYFDGYAKQPVVLIEEFKGNRLTPTLFNQLVDRNPLAVPIHGGFVQFDSPYIIITTNVAPRDWWPSVAFQRSLQRRILMFRPFHNSSVGKLTDWDRVHAANQAKAARVAKQYGGSNPTIRPITISSSTLLANDNNSFGLNFNKQ